MYDTLLLNLCRHSPDIELLQLAAAELVEQATRVDRLSPMVARGLPGGQGRLIGRWPPQGGRRPTCYADLAA